ncbi:MAG: DNA polymerase Y family protein [Pseudomonadota bacterium]
MSRRARTNPHPDLFAAFSPAQSPAREGSAPAPARITPVSRTAAPPQPEVSRDPVWLCVYFPALPLQVHKVQCDIDAPCVVVDDDAARTIVAVNRAAHGRSVFTGHKLKHALAMCAQLTIIERDAEAERQQLLGIAESMIAFSPAVSPEPPDMVLLEVRASLKLFEGIESLCAQLLHQLRSAGHHVRYSVAPSASAAQWLVRAGVFADAQDVVAHGARASHFQQQLGALGIGVTGWAPNTITALREMGVERIADCRRLPRAGLARRFGPGLLQSLAQAFGELPELRTPLQPTAHFSDVLLLDAEISVAQQLAQACEVLLGKLEHFLRQQQGAVRVLRFIFHGWREQAGTLTVSLSQPGFRLVHWQRLLQAHLDRCQLTQPVVSVSLQADISETLSVRTLALDLEADKPSHLIDNTALHDLLDRLRARLGDDAVNALRHMPNHRPEQASQSAQPDSDAVHSDLPPDWLLRDVPANADTVSRSHSLLLQRPLWLLPAAKALPLHDATPQYHGALSLLHGPERIDSGWWEARYSTRDYFIAENPSGTRLWVYRERDAEGVPAWWLHGVFG